MSDSTLIQNPVKPPRFRPNATAVVRYTKTGVILIVKDVDGHDRFYHAAINDNESGYGFMFKRSKCHCGSGKTYKNCCAKLDIQARLRAMAQETTE